MSLTERLCVDNLRQTAPVWSTVGNSEKSFNMADQRQDDTNSRTSSLPSHSTGSQNGDDMTHNEIKGWLMKRTRLSRKWKKQWFLLKNTDLFYGDSPENTMKKIPLANAEISETGVDKKAHAFRLKPKDNSRIYYIQADNESIQNDWMQAICFAKAAGRNGDASQACVVQ